ncbi:hypothetical protein ABIE28_002959 [Devosia sp. 2618]
MAANLPILITAILSLFGIFMIGLAYGSWATRDVVLTPKD